MYRNRLRSQPCQRSTCPMETNSHLPISNLDPTPSRGENQNSVLFTSLLAGNRYSSIPVSGDALVLTSSGSAPVSLTYTSRKATFGLAWGQILPWDVCTQYYWEPDVVCKSRRCHSNWCLSIIVTSDAGASRNPAWDLARMALSLAQTHRWAGKNKRVQ